LRKTIEAPRGAGREVVGWIEVVDLSGQARPEWGRVEAGDDADGRLTAENAGPQAGGSTANRR
jgi:hypothetical protein